MEELINIIEQKALKVFQRTEDKNDGLKHNAHVYIICFCFILGNDSIPYLCGKVINKYTHRISLASYQANYKTLLKSELVKYVSRSWFARADVVSKAT